MSAGVDVFELEAAALKELTEWYVAERTEFVAAFAPRARKRIADAPKHDLLRHLVKVETATGREEWKVIADLLFDVRARSTQKRSQAAIETEFLPVRADEV